MKILIVITKSEIGGAQVFALNLARGLKKAGVEVVVAGGPGDYLPAELQKSDIAFHRFQKLERSRNPFKALEFIGELSQYAREGHFDVVHLNSTNALLGVWGLKNIKTVFTVHGLSLIDQRHQALAPIKAAYKLFFRLAFKKLNKIIFVSRLNFEFAKKSGLLRGGLEQKSFLIYNGVNFDDGDLLGREEARAELAKALNLDPETTADFKESFIYGSIGRLAYPKNYEFLISSHLAIKASKPNAKILIIGEGPEREKYENLVKLYKAQDSIFLTGEMTGASKYLKAFDCFVICSIFEGLSLSLIEAHQAGVPSLASRVGGNEEIVGRNNCFTLNDAKDFKDKLLGISVKAVSHDRDTFSMDRMINGYLDAYQK